MTSRRARITAIIVTALMLWGFPRAAGAVRLKEISSVQGVRDNPLIGYGLVVGLMGTGDKNNTQFTVRSLVNMLKRLGVAVTPEKVQVKNVAAVMVTAKLPPFIRPGQKIDALVSSVGDAKSLQGGTLLMTPIKGADGRIYAVAQGPISVGGYSFGGSSGTNVLQNHPTVGTITNGALVERPAPFDLPDGKGVRFILDRADFTTARRAALALNQRLGPGMARCIDARTLELSLPEGYVERAAEFIALAESVEVVPDTTGRIVLDERTGTVIMGEQVRVDPVAIAQGGLTVIIQERPEVSQPLPFSPAAPQGAAVQPGQLPGVDLAPGGQTVVAPRTDIQVEEGSDGVALFNGGVTIGQLVKALNAIGASPRQLITIFQAIDRAGALRAHLEII
jgi:flagellar P-ring protein precursor FlgI